MDYLTSLVVDAIWLSPIFESPSYHGYDVQDFYSIERSIKEEFFLLDEAIADIGIISNNMDGYRYNKFTETSE